MRWCTTHVSLVSHYNAVLCHRSNWGTWLCPNWGRYCSPGGQKAATSSRRSLLSLHDLLPWSSSHNTGGRQNGTRLLAGGIWWKLVRQCIQLDGGERKRKVTKKECSSFRLKGRSSLRIYKCLHWQARGFRTATSTGVPLWTKAYVSIPMQVEYPCDINGLLPLILWTWNHLYYCISAK